MSWTIGIQRELAPNLSLDVAYIGSHSTHLPPDSNFNFVDQKYLSLGNLLLQTAGSPGRRGRQCPRAVRRVSRATRGTPWRRP